MTVGRTYRMTASAGHEDKLADELSKLRQAVSGMPGNRGIEVYRDRADRARFLLIEKWVSLGHHEQAVASLPKGSFDALMGMLALPPEAAYEDLLD